MSFVMRSMDTTLTVMRSLLLGEHPQKEKPRQRICHAKGAKAPLPFLSHSRHLYTLLQVTIFIRPAKKGDSYESEGRRPPGEKRFLIVPVSLYNKPVFCLGPFEDLLFEAVCST